MRVISLCLLAICAFINLPAQMLHPDLSYYLPADESFDPSIPTPQKVLGFEVGEWHITHDQQVRYMETLAAASDRVHIDTIGYSYEKRPLIHLTITSEDQQSQIETLRQQHLDWTNPEKSASMEADNTPLVVWMGYNVHGNESSSGNAAVVMAYYLAAVQGPLIEEVLGKTVVILDPCYNPDGFQRYSTWVNMHKGTHVLQTHPSHREHNEVWPGGRTNHYWFDLNRDWLPVQHPESQARLTRFHQWKPNFLTDHHEMGTNSTFFFQPGIPSRNNPLTPPKVFDLTQKMGSYHAQYLDEIGSLYYSKESFDDFYYGKGSTYPDINGGVGILFEQARVEGHAQQSANGILAFPFAIRNQFRTSLSTLYGTHNLRSEFLDYQRDFFNTATDLPKGAPSGYAIKVPHDQHRLQELLDVLSYHQIEVSSLSASFSANEVQYIKGKDVYVSLKQPQRRLIEALFEPVTEFQDSLFYDVSTWTMPMAFDLTYATVPANIQVEKNAPAPFTMPLLADGLTKAELPFAFLLPPYPYQNPRFLNRCFKNNVRVKVGKEPFVSGNRPFPRGTYMIPVQNQEMEASELVSWIKEQAKELKLPMDIAETGLTGGVNLGSNTFQTLEAPKILLVVGPGVTSYEAGEVWHLLDTRYEMEVTMAEMSRINKRTLADFNTLVMANGSYNAIKSGDDIEEWVKQGGNIIAYKGALNWIAGQGWTALSFEEAEKADADFSRTYSEQSNIRGAQVVGGAICKAFIDRTHPLGFGFEQDTIHVFRNSTRFMSLSKQPFTSPVRYTDQPLASGYISDVNLEALKGTAAVNVYRVGRGKIVAMTDNPNFRAFWYGTNRLFANAIFLAGII